MRGIAIAIVGLFAVACERSESPTPILEPDLLVRCGSLIDGIGDEVLVDRIVVIRAERIVEILPGADPSLAGAEVVDLSSQTCLPGLIDMHVHLDGYPDDADDYSVYLERTPDDTLRIAAELANTVLQAGFTTVRHTGSYLAWVDRDLRTRIEAGEFPGPRIQVGGPYLTIPHGGGDMYIPGVPDRDVPDYYRRGVARGADGFRRKAEQIVAGGADFLKVIASGAVFGHGGVPGAPELTRAEIEAIVEVARDAGIKVTAHAHSAESIKDAILAGVDSIEHASYADDESIALALEHGVALSMDVYNGTWTAQVGLEKGYPEEFMRKNEETTGAQRVAFRKALAAGVTLVFGTDLGVLDHRLGARQFATMVDLGMTPLQAIRSATTVAAEHLGLTADVGAIEAGRYADLIAVPRDPLQDITALQEVSAVIKGGTIVRNDIDPEQPAVDTIYHSGRIYTMNAEEPWAQAVAIKDGRIVFVGSDDRIRPLIKPGVDAYDLSGRLMLPGFQDAHVHPLQSGLESMNCYLGDGASIEDYRQILSACAEKFADKAWITGGGWSMAAFGEGAIARKDIIDEFIAEQPVYLVSADGHTGWANSAALEAAGITADTEDPPDGRIDRDPESGEPLGSLQEGAMRLVTRHLPEVSLADRIEGLRIARDTLHRVGITSVQEAYAGEQELLAYEALDQAGELQIRTVVALLWDNQRTEEQLAELISLRERFSKGNIRAGSVKIFVDGVMENYTALMLEPYLLDEPTRGVPMIDLDDLDEAVAAIDAERFQVHFHALGDGAVREALDAVATARERNGASDRRHHLAHLQVIHPDDIPRFAELEAAANFQPLWAYADDYIVDLTWPFVSAETAKWMYPIKSVFDSGATVAFGSDWSVSTVNPMPQIETAVTRKDAESNDSPDMNPEQRITLEQAIAAFTLNAAWVNHQENVTGSVEVGKFADLVVLDKNLFEIEPQEISEARVLLTLFGGEPVFGDPLEL